MIDSSQFLPKGMPPVNPYRAQHAGIKWEGKLIRNLTWLPDILLDREIITGDHLHTCLVFQRAVMSTRAALGISDLRHYISENTTHNDKAPADIFFIIINKLSKNQSNLCLWTVCDDYNRGNYNLAYHLRGSIAHALEDAQKIIDNL